MKNKWMGFQEARKLARRLNLNGFHDWKKYCNSGNRPFYIPSNPHVVYKNKGWFSWADWLSTKNIVGSIRKYYVNDDYFKKWSHDMAYILGFWFADGCIMEGNIFRIAQHKDDEYILYQMSKCMQSTYKIRLYRSMRCISVVSKPIIEDIIKLGGKYRKSLDVEFPHVPKEYLPDFIRGLWDGDGCISIYKNHDINAVMTSGSKSFIEEMYKILKKNINGFNGRVIERTNDKKRIIYRIVLSANNSRHLRDYMYQHKGLFLIRKYDNFLKIGNVNIATYNRQYWTYKRAQTYVKRLKIKTFKEWFLFSKSGKRPCTLPSNPWKIYCDKGWIGLREFIGR